MKKRKIIYIVLAIILIGGFFAYNYIYKEHRDIKNETSSLEITAPYLLERFMTDDASELLNSTITVSGVVSQIEEGAISLDTGVYCTLIEPMGDVSVGDAVKIKGRCLGYDDLFEIVKLDQCTIVK